MDILEYAILKQAGGGGGKLYHHRVRATFQNMSWDLGMASAFSGHPGPFVVEFDMYSTKAAAFTRIEEVLKIGECINCFGYTGNDDTVGYDNYETPQICGRSEYGFWVGLYKTFSSGMSAPEFYDIYADDIANVSITDAVTEV